ncbi:MAG: VOC family protein [Spirochaetes bacterium]|nr:VOC family protein [Spirochaetota bacterium]
METNPMFQIGKIDQVGVAVRNADEAAKFMQAAFGLTFTTFNMPEARAILHGREVRFITRISIARAGAIDLEMMQILEGDHIVKEFMESHGPGIHHLGIYVKDLNRSVKEWEEKGGTLLQRTAHPAGIGTAYLQIEGLWGGSCIELIKLGGG